MQTETVEVVVGWLATHVDGTVARLGPDRTRAENYACTHHATIEVMYCKRAKQAESGEPRGDLHPLRPA